MKLPLDWSENFEDGVDPDTSEVSDDQGPGKVDEAEQAGRAHADCPARVDVVEKKLFQHLKLINFY